MTFPVPIAIATPGVLFIPVILSHAEVVIVGAESELMHRHNYLSTHKYTTCILLSYMTVC